MEGQAAPAWPDNHPHRNKPPAERPHANDEAIIVGRYDTLAARINNAMLTRRRFTFWVGFGLFTLAEKLRAPVLDGLAAAAMRAVEPKSTAALPSTDPPTHWTAAENRNWRWFERETYLDGKWKLTGITTPVNKHTGEPKADSEGYLDEKMVPESLRDGRERQKTELPRELADRLIGRKPHPDRKVRHGRPPSKWLRSLNAEEIRIWLKTIEVPEAGVSGMTYWEHLTRDHFFDPAKIEGLTIDEQAKLHAAAHFGY